MKCKNLIKKDCTVFLEDQNGNLLDIGNDSLIQKYERANNVIVKDMVNEFLTKEDDGFAGIFEDIEKMVEKYHIDYFMYGDGKEVCEGSLALVYNLKNRHAYMDCRLKIFYNYTYSALDKLSYMIEFSSGSSGDIYGFTFYKHFNSSKFFSIKNMLEEYFACKDNFSDETKLIEICSSNVINRIKQYYS
ncbi:hypothetical protein [Clostridium tunisiense]|uniref:hypothetical protein n=1 Tax=Clostridium tunisiense TaxID=219748 RepID=UPI0002E2EC5D|nr:hypothetical protein [Clostridium tunisiense]